MRTREIAAGRCASLLHVSRDFIYDEIKRGKLKASPVSFPSGRVRYHIQAEDFDAYRRQYWSENNAQYSVA